MIFAQYLKIFAQICFAAVIFAFAAQICKNVRKYLCAAQICAKICYD